MQDTLATVLEPILPVKVECIEDANGYTGKIQYLLSRVDADWVVTLINNQGVLKPEDGDTVIDTNKKCTVRLSWPGSATTLRGADPMTVLDGFVVVVPAGDVAVVRLAPPEKKPKFKKH